MPKITFLPSGKTIDVPSGTLLMDAAGQSGIMIDLPCGGKGTCGKCLVQITHGTVACNSDIQLTDEERGCAGLHALSVCDSAYSRDRRGKSSGD